MLEDLTQTANCVVLARRAMLKLNNSRCRRVHCSCVPKAILTSNQALSGKKHLSLTAGPKEGRKYT